MNASEETVVRAQALRELADAAGNTAGGNLREMLGSFARQRLKAADHADAESWSRVHSRQDWEAFRAPRLAALRASLGDLPARTNTSVRVTKTLKGDGHVLHGLVYTSREGDPVSANLYAPDPPREKMPGILICHSHHRPKVQNELQDMGMTWARVGCLVLVPDLPSYGERRHQPFEGRQEYYFRYHIGMQLQLAGESLIGRIVWDLWRGVDALLQQPGIDATRIVLLGAVAGGGDPAAVAAALDERIACAAPFNFGGPQPETVVSNSQAAQTFAYTGSGGWESTRNLRLSARDGFLPWVIVGGIAPRALVYAHEFEWNAKVDPVWARLQNVFAWHGAAERIGSVHGKGQVTQPADVATHCNQIGAVHRAQMYPLLEKWFGMTRPEEYSQRREPAELNAFTEEIPRTPVHLQARAAAEAKIKACRDALAGLSPAEAIRELRTRWARVLGMPESIAPKVLLDEPVPQSSRQNARRVVLETEPGIQIPLLLLAPESRAQGTVVALAQQGSARFLKGRAEALSDMLSQNLAICLADLRGFGASDPDGDRSWFGKATRHSSSELMLGRTQLGNQLFDLRSALSYLRNADASCGSRVAIWGDSLAPVNPPGFADPQLRTQPAAAIGEPSGGLLALLGALFEEHVVAAFARRTLRSWLDVFESPFVHLPHDVLVPNAASAGDLGDLVQALGSRAITADLIDGRNLAIQSPAAPSESCETWIAHALRINKSKE